MQAFPRSRALDRADRIGVHPRERLILLVLLGVALLHGLTYVFLVPPWGHYDEPTHFEYGWWIANRLRLPQEGDVDRGMRREVAASMLEHGFYRDIEVRPNLLPQPEPISIGISEFGHPPLYYALIALPLRLLRHTDVALQLYLGRLVSLSLYLASLAIAYGLIAELVPPGHVLRWAVPGTMVLIPSYVDLMTAVNNDAGAVVMFSLFLWSAVRLIVRGPTVARLGGVALTTALCVLTKATASVALPLALLALALAWYRPSPHWRWAWLALLAAGVLLGLLLRWGDAAFWVRFSTQRSPTSQRVAYAPDGTRALALEFDPRALLPQDAVAPDRAGRDSRALQILPREDVEALQGVTVTLSAWMWATQPVRVRGPALDDGARYVVEVLDIDRTPALYVLTTMIDAEARYVQVFLRPEPQLNMAGADPDFRSPLVVYYDQVVLAEPDRPSVNRVRNGSAERTWPYVHPAVDEAILRYTRRSISQVMASVLDWRRTSRVYRYTALILFQSFWARFGWGNIALAEGWYWGLGVLTALGAAGAVRGGARIHALTTGVRRAIGLLLAAGLLVWLNTLLRVHPLATRAFIPVARYAYPAIVPTVLALVCGWLALVPRRYWRWGTLAGLCVLILLDVVSIRTLLAFYYGR